jgi:hypothetical protein
LLNLRTRYRLTQRRAARLVFSSLRAWQYWEDGTHKMHPAIWGYAKFAARLRERRMAEANAQRIATAPRVDSTALQEVW